ncbi:hypothetical protein ABBQ32_006753 [Trebouxia sp. C0010 RCD-2024]
MLGAVQQAHVQQVQTSLPMTSGSHQLQQQLQQVLSLFDGDTAAGLAAKESALTKLVMLVAGNMTVAQFLASMDKLQGPEKHDRKSRYYQSICRLVQRPPGAQKVEDVLGKYFDSLYSGIWCLTILHKLVQGLPMCHVP